jgi:hypothetical protein
MSLGFWWESQKEYLDTGERIILKWIIERWDRAV